MDLIQLIVILVIIGVLLYLLNQHIPMAPAIKTIINTVVVLVVILWVLRLFVPPIHLGRVP